MTRKDSKQQQLNRRQFLGVSALGGVGVLAASASTAQGGEKQATPEKKSAPKQTILIKREHAKDLWALKPAKIEPRGGFDLDDPMGNWLGTMKTSVSLAGARSYVGHYFRVFACPAGKQAQPFYAGAGCWTHQLVEPTAEILAPFGNIPKGTVMQLALYTAVVLDPYTFEPVKTIRNPITGRMLEPQDSFYAESYLIYPGGGMTSLERPELLDERKPKRYAYLRSGAKTSFNLDALFAGDGPHQPRLDASWWTVDHADLMNPDVPDIDADYSWVGLMQGYERPWWGFTQADRVQTLWNVHGTVAKDIKRVEPIVQEHVFAKYPGRV
jgi:hypothetical protein